MPQTEGHSISWDVVTHVHKERTNDWYWALGLVPLWVPALSLWVGDILFSIIIILGAGSLGMLAARGPREHGVHISEQRCRDRRHVVHYAPSNHFGSTKIPMRHGSTS